MRCSPAAVLRLAGDSAATARSPQRTRHTHGNAATAPLQERAHNPNKTPHASKHTKQNKTKQSGAQRSGAPHLAERAAPYDRQRLKVGGAHALALQPREVRLAALQFCEDRRALRLGDALARELLLQRGAPFWRVVGCFGLSFGCCLVVGGGVGGWWLASLCCWGAAADAHRAPQLAKQTPPPPPPLRVIPQARRPLSPSLPPAATSPRVALLDALLLRAVHVLDVLLRRLDAAARLLRHRRGGARGGAAGGACSAAGGRAGAGARGACAGGVHFFQLTS